MRKKILATPVSGSPFSISGKRFPLLVIPLDEGSERRSAGLNELPVHNRHGKVIAVEHHVLVEAHIRGLQELGRTSRHIKLTQLRRQLQGDAEGHDLLNLKKAAGVGPQPLDADDRKSGALREFLHRDAPLFHQAAGHGVETLRETKLIQAQGRERGSRSRRQSGMFATTSGCPCRRKCCQCPNAPQSGGMRRILFCKVGIFESWHHTGDCARRAVMVKSVHRI